ncbi:MAG: YdcF family protein [Hyphomonadaceae bacterium]
MSWLRGAMLATLTALAVAFGLGFIAFAHAVRSARPADPVPDADAIVALTGGSMERLEAGVRLLKAGHGRRLLISGVNPSVKDEELFALLRIDHALARCCVDLGRAAADTLGNASEAAAWTRRNGFRSLILVTDDYHMPRSLTEMRLARPDARIIPYPVKTRWTQGDRWRREWGAATHIGGEYVKYLTIRAREALIDMSRNEPPPQKAPAS